MSPKQSILIYKKKNHYNEWEFVYDPLSDQKMISSSTGALGTSATSSSNSVGGTSLGTSSSGGNSGSNSSSGSITSQ